MEIIAGIGTLQPGSNNEKRIEECSGSG